MSISCLVLGTEPHYSNPMRKVSSQFLAASALALFIFFAPQNAISAQQEVQQQESGSYVDGEVLIKFKKEEVDVSKFS